MNVRESVTEAVRLRRLDELEEILVRDRRAVRILVGLTYHADGAIRSGAADGLALAARHHPKLIQEVVRRLVWAMNDESGTHAVTAPDVVVQLARTVPDLLVPFVADLLRLTGDPSLREKLVEAVRLVAAASPRGVTSTMSDGLRSCGRAGGRGSDGRQRSA
ncbi:MAG: hypothetical protein ACM3O7_09250 [Acidobacteriota bacterium]